MKKIKDMLKGLFEYQDDDKKYEFLLGETQEEKIQQEDPKKPDTNPEPAIPRPQALSTAIASNLENVRILYNSLINSDIIIREFSLTLRNKLYKAFILYIDGMVDSNLISDFILKPLMMRNIANTYEGEQQKVIKDTSTNNVIIRKVEKFDALEYVFNQLIPQNNVQKVTEYKEVSSAVNSGNCVLFIDTLSTAFDIEVKGFKQRSIDKPTNEVVIRGPQEAFTENIRTNSSLLRRIINNEDLIIESTDVGKISKTKCGICYLKNIANSDLVAEVKYRINNIDIDYVTSSGQLEQLIEDNGRYSLPQLIATERPDKCSNYLLEGRVCVLLNGSPYGLIAPGTFLDFMSSPEDYNLKFQFANLLKFLRILAVFITLLLPGLYMAITNFHQELLPTELLFSILSSREAVPFPIFFEILVMEISFELIREAGLRVPSPIGPTIGIVGALVLGQAAVDASIVSPILIIIVAITGISSFSIPDFSLGFHCRIVRFAYIILGYALGFLGIAVGMSIHLLIACNLHSFGSPYLQPYVPMTRDFKGILLSPAWQRENRADFLNTKRQKRQNKVSMKWKYMNK